MKILIIGSGGREHALAWKISQSPKLKKLYALPGSDGIAQFAECVPGNPSDIAATVETCRKLGVDLVVVGPEAPLAAGLCDALKAAKIPAFGPLQSAARLESSKSFAKEFMQRHQIPTANFEFYDDPALARNAVITAALPIVVKADGLAAGKGVRVCVARDEAIEAVQDFMNKKTLGSAGARVVLEERLEGQEVSVMALCDGRSVKILPVSRDHKRLKDGDEGPNTGGMGAFAPVALAPDTNRRIREEILDRALAGLHADGIPYCGILYCGLMLTPKGPKVLEFNVRFGDPETQVVLPLIKSDIVELMEACINGKLEESNLELNPISAVCIVMASPGYPDAPHPGQPISGFEAAHAANPEGLIFHAGTSHVGNKWTTAGGRVLSVVATAITIDRARALAYTMADRIRFEGAQYRRDIAVTAGPAMAPVTAMQPSTARKQ